MRALLPAQGSRIYFPTADAVRVYDLHSGALLQALKGHFGEALCAAAAASDHKVFTGGDDCSILAWTPPPCGLTAPAPREEPVPAPHEQRRDAFLAGAPAGRLRQDGGIAAFIEAGGAAAPATVATNAEVEDGDAWSEDEAPPHPAPPRPPPKRRRRR
mmetsp:Transcript_21321/g.72050  ORF Transcript_21321/g.72050 Transcript_21321/m.72050 type:complete len:158 (-) Transcript_21321:872-1345(-)